MRILVTSDTHMFNDYLENLIEHYQDNIDLWIHCGDSSLPKNSSLLKRFNIVVKGNHDEEDFPIYEVYQDIYVTHGNIDNIYAGYDCLIQQCINHHCHLCFHGHTHVPTIQKINDITFINPGSLMMNRGSYGYGTYAIVEKNNNCINVQFFHHQTHQECPWDIIEEGYALLKEFQLYVKK